MKLQFKQQNFQTEAANAVCDVFFGQPYLSHEYQIDKAISTSITVLNTGWNNAPISPEVELLENVIRQQKSQELPISDKMDSSNGCPINLTVEMETGVGKTYTYIKTIYELNKRYGWCKFIIVVPSIAIREGVASSFKATEDHFQSIYGSKIRYFIYNSKQLDEVKHFATDSAINVMIINSQAFNAKGKDARRMYMKLDDFGGIQPIDVIARTNPILIIDEPQSVEGKETKESLKRFNAMIMLRYSATHRKDSIYNMVYRLDAVDAYNKKLVKKIAVKGIKRQGNVAINGYIYLESINLSESYPTATIEFDIKTKDKTKRISKTVDEGFALYDQSGGLEEYKGITVTSIRGDTNTVEFSNGLKLKVGEVTNKAEEKDFRRIQIIETIKAHIEKESALFKKGIKVLSLFFIDEVAKYRIYTDGVASNGEYADIFEEEYQRYLDEIVYPNKSNFSEEYINYLKTIAPQATHEGYFSIDKKKGIMVDSKENKKEGGSDDIDAYNLIMKNKERLLDLSPAKSPVRFIFSHSALREGWDNPNVFQICTLKQANSETKKRQEVGRGLRLCVNQKGERMDESVLGKDVHNINKLTIIASESYDDFSRAIQNEISEVVHDRPLKVTVALLEGLEVILPDGTKKLVDNEAASNIFVALKNDGYVDKANKLTDKYHDDIATGSFTLSDPDLVDFESAIQHQLERIYDGSAIIPEDANNNNVTVKLNKNNFAKKEFKELWSRINAKTMYLVDFDSNALVQKAINALNKELTVSEVTYQVQEGEIQKIESKQTLDKGKAFSISKKEIAKIELYKSDYSKSIKIDLIGKLVEATGLTRKDIVSILTGISAETFNMYKKNPEEFILKAANIINAEKAVTVVEKLTYDFTNEEYSTDIFTDAKAKGKLNVNTMPAEKHIFSHVIYDSDREKEFATELEKFTEVAVYAKLPRGFFISTPVGKYNPDWAIAFKQGTVKHIYFVAETKGTNDTLNLRKIEDAKIRCAEKHFEKLCEKISNDKVVYHHVKDFETMLAIVRQ